MTYNLLVDYIIKHQDTFYRIAFSYVKNQADALDIVQDSIEKSLKSYMKLREPNYIKTWFYKILTNTAVSYIRKRKKVFHLSRDQVYHDHSYLDLYDAIDTLTAEEKTIIILRYFEYLKFKDISEITGMNINTVKTRHTRILETLKISLEEVDNV